MAKDYRRGNQRSRSSAPRRLLGVLAAFLGGYLAATIFDFTSLSTWVNDHLLTEKQTVQPQAKVAKRPAELPKPKFEFYTLLSKDSSVPEVRPKAPTTPAATTPNTPPQQSMPATPTPTANNTQAPQQAVPVTQSKPVKAREAYLIQVAAFNRRPDAENLKAGLVLKGFDVSIATVTTQQGVNWYRVMIGPFHSQEDAQKAQAALVRSEHIKGLIRKFEV